MIDWHKSVRGRENCIMQDRRRWQRKWSVRQIQVKHRWRKLLKSGSPLFLPSFLNFYTSPPQSLLSPHFPFPFLPLSFLLPSHHKVGLGSSHSVVRVRALAATAQMHFGASWGRKVHPVTTDFALCYAVQMKKLKHIMLQKCWQLIFLKFWAAVKSGKARSMAYPFCPAQ